jgi:hypothetical protein
MPRLRGRRIRTPSLLPPEIIQTLYPLSTSFHGEAIFYIHGSVHISFITDKTEPSVSNSTSKNKSGDVIHYFFITLCHYFVLILLLFDRSCLFSSVRRLDAPQLFFFIISDRRPVCDCP